MVEIALLLPAFCMLMFGVFSFSMVMVSYLSATYWLREAARYAGVHSLTSISPASTSNVSDLITSNIFLPSGSPPTISVSYVYYVGAANGNYVGNAVLVTAAWTQTISIPFYSRTLSLQNQTYRIITH